MAAWHGWAAGAWAGWTLADTTEQPVVRQFYRTITPRRKGKRLPVHEDLEVEITEAFEEAEEIIKLSTPVYDDGFEKSIKTLTAEITKLEKSLMARRLDEEDAEMLLL